MCRPQTFVIATVTLFPTHAGGRRGATPPDKLHCIMFIDGQNFDVRLYFDSVGSMAPGDTARVPIYFLAPDIALPHCAPGKKFILRELKTIGDGVIEEVIQQKSGSEKK